MSKFSWVLLVNVGPPLLSHFCPLSTFCPVPVPFLSTFCPISVLCPTFVSFLSLSSQFCPVLDYILSSLVSKLSHFCPHMVLSVHRKWSGQILDKNGTESFFHFQPGHPAGGQKWDKNWTPVPNLSSICPCTLFI